MAFEKGNPGRPRGSSNKMTQKLKAWSEQYGDQWVDKVWDLACNATKDSDRLKALDLLGKKVLPDMKSVDHTGGVMTNNMNERIAKLTPEQFKALLDVELLDGDDEET